MIWKITAQLLLLSLSISGAQSAVHKVTVGNGGFIYRPNVTYAKVGDIVTFEFFPTNHSVYRAVFTNSPECPGGYCNPCVPSNLYPKQNDFFFSGLIEGNINNPPTWNLTINDTAPVFYSCNAPGSCHPNGMVGVINPNSSTPIETQIQAAQQAQYQLSPGQSFPSEGMPTAPGSSTSPSTPSSSSSSSKSSGLSGGAIAGIVVGCVAGVAILGAAIYFWARSRTYGQIFSASNKGGSSAPGGSEQGGVGAWLEGQQTQQAEKRATLQDPEILGGQQPGGATPTSPKPHPNSPGPQDGAQFIGFNRQSGGPEYAVEAPGIDNQISELQTAKSRDGGAPAEKEPESPTGRIELP